MDSKPDLRDDRAWLDAFRRGERAALERVFRTYATTVLAVLRHGSRTKDGQHHAPGLDEHAAEDLLHDVFLEAFKEPVRLRYDGVRPYAPFLLQIARFRLLDAARRNGRLAPGPGPAGADPAAYGEGPLPPDELLLREEERAQVRAFKDALSDDDRRFVRVRFEEGRSQVDAASLLGRSRQQIRTWDEKIRERFREFIKK